MSAHLRALHQVAAGEPTIADVPVATLGESEGPQPLERQEPVLSAAR
jgi:hypothetical protein